MASSVRHETALKLFSCAAGLLLLMLALEGLLPSLACNSPVSRLFHLLIVLVLVLLLVSLGLIIRRSSADSKTAFTREMSEMQREVAKSAWRYKCLLEGAGNAIFVFNVENGILEEVNRKATELLGYSREEMMSMHGRDLVARDEYRKFSSLVARVLRRGRGRSEGLRFRRKNGGDFYGEIDARLIDLSDCKLVHVIVRDITFKRKAEREIRQRNRELSILMNFMARVNQTLELHTVLDVTLCETIEVLGADGGIVHLVEDNSDHLVLAATHGVTGRFKEELQQCSFRSKNNCFIVDSPHCHSTENLDGARCSLGRLSFSDGWLSSAAAPLHAQDRLIGIMHVFSRKKRRFNDQELNVFATMGRQIGIVIEHARLFEELNCKTEELLRSYQLLEKNSHNLAVSQRKLNKNLVLFEKANQELGRVDQMKNHFLGMISHEFRTPLTGIMSGSEFLLNTLENEKEDERKILQMIYRGGLRLNEIVSDLLRVIRLEADRTIVNRSILHLSEVVELMQEQFEPLLKERGQNIVVENMDNLPHFSGDRAYLEEVFTKLLENAVKFSMDGGEIVIAAQVANRIMLSGKKETLTAFNRHFYEQMGHNCYLQVEVRDNGVGIAPEEQLKIFDKFYEIGDIRHHSSGKHKFQGKGAGLGLAIVKGMVEAHGGMVWAESPSIAGEGSSFFLLLPLEEELKQSAFPFMQNEVAPVHDAQC